MPSFARLRAVCFAFTASALLLGCDDARTPSVDAGSASDASLGADGGDRGDASDAASTRTVQGLLVDQLSGVPVAGAIVFVADREGVVSDTSGRFAATDVTPPYDVAIRASGTKKVRVFQGLTTDAPVLAIDSDATMRTANVSGHAIFAFPSNASDRLTCVLTGPRLLGGFTRVTGPSDSPVTWNMSGGGFYDFPARWWGGSNVDGATHCFLDRFTDGTVSASFHGSLPITLASAGTFPDQEVTLAPAPLSTVSGTVVDPLSGADLTLSVGPAFADASGYYASSGPEAPGAFSRVVPYVPGAFVLASVSDPTGSRVSTALVPASDSIALDLVLLAPPTLTAPVPGSTGVDPEAPMTWEGGEGHVFRAVVTTSDGTSAEILTTRTSTVLPDLARFGLAYPPGGNASVVVVEYSVPTVDALVKGPELVLWLSGRRTVSRADTGTKKLTFAN